MSSWFVLVNTPAQISQRDSETARSQAQCKSVMAGLDPAIHEKKPVDPPIKSGDDGLLTVALTGGIVL